MTPAICFALSALLLILGLHPFITYPLTLRLLARERRRVDQPTRRTRPGETFAILVCAYNEEATIERKIANLLALRRRMGALEILVYVDAATDRTAELLEHYRGEITLIVSPQRHGKVHGMNLLAARAEASVLVFTDANVILEETAIEALGRAFADPRVGCVCGHLIYVNAQETPTAAVGSFYWRLEEQIKDYESALGAVMGADGSIFALRRSLHRPVPLHLLDDMFLSLNALCSGYRVVRAKDAIALERSATAPGEEFFRKIRIACQAFNGHRVLWPRIRQLPPSVVYMYLSHKLLRWFSIYTLCSSALAAAIGLSALGVPPPITASAAVAFIGILWWGASRGLRPFAQIREVMLALLGAGVGVAQSVRGETFQTWTPASSVRK